MGVDIGVGVGIAIGIDIFVGITVTGGKWTMRYGKIYPNFERKERVLAWA